MISTVLKSVIRLTLWLPAFISYIKARTLRRFWSHKLQLLNIPCVGNVSRSNDNQHRGYYLLEPFGLPVVDATLLGREVDADGYDGPVIY